jgi:photosystem II stability/assembly factor-like uncharacterized protein
MAAAPGGFLAVLCLPVNVTGRTYVLISTNYGSSWGSPRPVPGGTRDGLSLIAAASPATLAVSTGATGGSGAFTARVLVSTDAGRNWTTGAADTQQLTDTGTPAWLGFQTSRAGEWIGDPHSIWTTPDGGWHWVRTAFG